MVSVIYGLERVERLQRSVLTVGNFDGVHVGHQAILAKARALGKVEQVPVIVMTFDPHPLQILAPAHTPLRLMPVEERASLLVATGADMVVIVRSDESFLSIEAGPFIHEIMMSRFGPLHIVEGASFRFGKGRKGTPDLLRCEGQQYGCQVHILEPVSVLEDGVHLVVSSSLIRRLLTQGDAAQAATCLSRPYAIEGRVMRGAGRGRGLGFPTANVEIPVGQVEPGEGVYAGYGRVGSLCTAAAISVGRAETFGGGKKQLEAYLLDYEGDLYGKHIRIEFAARVRDQKKFSSAEELRAQIDADVQVTRRILFPS